MIDNLTTAQIAYVLQRELIGRIGCSADNEVYVVPIAYAFDGKYIYAHSREGMKIEMMRKNPDVCFEVDRIENMRNWTSIIVRGKFQELTREIDRTRALKILNDRLVPYGISETMEPRGPSPGKKTIEKDRKPVVYRISITEMTGRYEKTL
jgi:nitroimidazol reductase NimA-like FMN-containing flavoprotein (pyridoxamine 5'-phosphate oxidase superfamily)